MQDTTLIGPGIRVDGDFRGEGDVVVAGRLDGSVHTSGRVTVNQGGLLLADVTANEVRIEGVLEGDVRAATGVSIGPHGTLQGHVQGKLSIDDGGIFRGTVDRDGQDSPPERPRRAAVTTVPSAGVPVRPTRKGATAPGTPAPAKKKAGGKKARSGKVASKTARKTATKAPKAKATRSVKPAQKTRTGTKVTEAMGAPNSAADGLASSAVLDDVNSAGRRRKPLGPSDTGSVRSLVGLPPTDPFGLGLSESADDPPITEWTPRAPGLASGSPALARPAVTRRAAPAMPPPAARRPRPQTTNPSAARPDLAGTSFHDIPAVSDPLVSLAGVDASGDFEAIEAEPPRRLDATDSGVHPSVEPRGTPRGSKATSDTRKTKRSPAPAGPKKTRAPTAPARSARKAEAPRPKSFNSPAPPARRAAPRRSAKTDDELQDAWFEDPDFLVKKE